jgi:Flp pilus assembly protein TadB
MLIWVVVAFATAAGAPAMLVVALGALTFQPVLGTVLLVAVALVRKLSGRRSDQHAEVSFLRDITAVVASGTTLRAAIRDGDPTIVTPTARRLCDSGMPMSSVGASMRESLPTNGEAFAAVCDLSEETGSSLVPTLFMLTDRARVAETMQRRRRIATAQARYSAGVVGIAPLVVTIVLIALRGVPGDGGPLIVIPIVAGATMQLLGVVTVLGLAARYS